MSKKSAIQSEQELVGTFIEESVGMYAKQKNNEHMGSASNEELRGWLKEDFSALLDGLRDSAADSLDKRKLDVLVETLKDNLDAYIDKMDAELTHARDQVLIKEGTRNPDSIKLDEALLKGAANSDLIKASHKIKGQDTGWKTAANLFNKMGITSLANFFEKKNEQAKLAALKKSVDRYVPSLKGHIASDQKATSTPLPKSEKPKQHSR